MISIKYSIGDAVKIVSGTYRGASGVVTGTTEKMYYIRLNTSQVVVRLMASSVRKAEENDNLNLEVAERIALELHFIRKSMETLVDLLNNFRL
jgi:ribosomal protein L24